MAKREVRIETSSERRKTIMKTDFILIGGRAHLHTTEVFNQYYGVRTENYEAKITPIGDYINRILALINSEENAEVRLKNLAKLLRKEFVYSGAIKFNEGTESFYHGDGGKVYTRSKCDVYRGCDLIEALIEVGAFANILKNAQEKNNGSIEVLQQAISGLDLSQVHFGQLNLAGFNFKGTKLVGARISGANLTGARFDHTDASGSNLTQAQVDNLAYCRHSKLPENVQGFWNRTTQLNVLAYLDRLKIYGETLKAHNNVDGQRIIDHAAELIADVRNAEKHNSAFQADFLEKLRRYDKSFEKYTPYERLVETIEEVITKLGISRSASRVCDKVSLGGRMLFFTDVAAATRRKQLARMLENSMEPPNVGDFCEPSTSSHSKHVSSLVTS